MRQRIRWKNSLDKEGVVGYPMPMDMNSANSAQIAETVDEARKGRSWWQACCLGCGLFLVAGIVALVFLFRFMAGAPIQSLTALPVTFPKDVAVYAPDQATSIHYAPGRQKSRLLHLVTAPLRLIGDVAETNGANSGEANKVLESYGEQIAVVDSVTVYWQKLERKPEDIVQFYSDELRKQQFEIQAVPAEQAGVEFLASRPDATVHATFRPSEDGTSVEDMVLTVTYTAEQAIQQK